MSSTNKRKERGKQNETPYYTLTPSNKVLPKYGTGTSHGLHIESDGRKIAFIRVFVSYKDNSSIKVIHCGIKEAIKHLIYEGFDVIRRTGDDYKDGGADMQVIVERMVSGTNEHLIVSIRSGSMDKFRNFDRINDALIQHMAVKGFKRL